MYLLMRQRSELPIGHLHYVTPDILPKVHMSKFPSQARWVELLTTMAMTMSGTELVEFERNMIKKHPNKAGRLGLKKSIFSMFLYVFGLQDLGQTTVFGLHGSSNSIATIFVDAVRIDVSNQTVFLDAACVALDDKLDYAKVIALLKIKNAKVIIIAIDDKEVPFWKYLLPISAERCRTWKHKSTCEYQSTGKMPLSTEPSKSYMCSCGLNNFPEGYLKHLKQPSDLLKNAVRVAIPLIFASPISPDDFSAALSPPSSSQSAGLVDPHHCGQTSQIINLDTKKDMCFVCGLKSTKDGGMLLRCSRCKFAQYCSAGCQAEDWKREHKDICKQLKQMNSQA